MEIDFNTTFTLPGNTYKEVRETLQAKVDEFLKGTKGARVQVLIEPQIIDHSIAGLAEVVAWECRVRITQTLAGDKK